LVVGHWNNLALSGLPHPSVSTTKDWSQEYILHTPAGQACQEPAVSVSRTLGRATGCRSPNCPAVLAGFPVEKGTGGDQGATVT